MNDTIVAPITAPGQAAVAVIRITGPECFNITNKIFDNNKFTTAGGQQILYGHIIDENSQLIDEVLVAKFINPVSYTKEDTVEISCHGSTYIIQLIIELILRKGARMAQRGEFTLRAFLNGQMDLTQAEAVADLIASQSNLAHDIALNQLRGGVSSKIKKLREELIKLNSLLELELDFGEEDVDFVSKKEILQLIDQICKEIALLLNSLQLGNIIKEGVLTAIVGKPNAGKSTLLNALVEDSRSIISNIPGTTRDIIEDSLNIKGIKFRLADTAGLRETIDPIEQEGVSKAMTLIKKSKLILILIDPEESDPTETENQLKALKVDINHVILVINKIDLYPDLVLDKYKTLESDPSIAVIAARENDGLTELKQLMFEKVVGSKNLPDSSSHINHRHYEALIKAKNALFKAKDAINDKIPSDLVATELRQAQYYLGEISGEISTDELLGSIFSNFCIGK